MISFSDNGEFLEAQGLLRQDKQDFFFSYAKQREHTYEVAKELFLQGASAGQAITDSKHFIQMCYEQIFKYKK